MTTTPSGSAGTPGKPPVEVPANAGATAQDAFPSRRSRGGWAHRLYTGDISFDFISRRRIWYALSGFVILLSIVGLGVRGLNLSIDFKGGESFTFPTKGHSISQVNDMLDGLGLGGDKSQVVKLGSTNGQDQFEITVPNVDSSKTASIEQAIRNTIGVNESQISPQNTGASFGSEVARQALYGLIAFIAAVVFYLSMAFEPKMAASAIVALIHDLVITAGIYALVGFVVSPSTVIALLTILGYSLYDTVVVFDKVRENTRDLEATNKLTFSEAANLAVNQTLVRSMNTSIIALLPVAGLLFIGAGVLGAGTLKDLSLALFIGLASGAYSSIFVATPLLCDMKEREPRMKELARRLETRRRAKAKEAAAAAANQPELAAVAAGFEGDAVVPEAPVAQRTRPGRPGSSSGAAGSPGSSRPSAGGGGRGRSGSPAKRKH